ncbi:hypothetical protein J618_1409 [Acinetobacter baumannii 607805]|nr:hypothetical protein J618_1409 [Acinetobacter baumannii 607805]
MLRSLIYFYDGFLLFDLNNFWGCSRLAEVLLYENEDKSL